MDSGVGFHIKFTVSRRFFFSSEIYSKLYLQFIWKYLFPATSIK